MDNQLRDDFAKAALQGLLSQPDDLTCKGTHPAEIEAERRAFALATAIAAYRYADAMLWVRAQRHADFSATPADTGAI